LHAIARTAEVKTIAEPATDNYLAVRDDFRNLVGYGGMTDGIINAES
jgi:hypothetical protein